jgi:hypothetical protein
MLGHPFALGAALEQNPHPPPRPKHATQEITPRRDAAMPHDLPLGGHDSNLTFLAVQIDGTILHGWLLLVSALFPQGVNHLCGAQATTHSRAATRFISSSWTFVPFVDLRALRGSSCPSWIFVFR